MALLAHLNGARPPAPAWFTNAMQQPPERGAVNVAGCAIETLAWGRVGDPGLLLIHGNTAHADWWSFLAPLFATTHRVAAFSLSGMGGSGWRDAYTLELYVKETFAAAEACGLFASPIKPVFVGHSFGCFPLLSAAAAQGERLRAIVALDMPVFSKEQRVARAQSGDGPRRERRSARLYASLEEALGRFRFLPPQECVNLYLVDHIARTSLKHVRSDAGEGWMWKFAPNLFEGYRMSNPVKDLAALRCPIAVMRGARSKLVDPQAFAYQKSVVPGCTPFVEIPEAEHHLMIDQPLAFVAALQALTAGWP